MIRDALICGAGAAGCAAALSLRKLGRTVLLADRCTADEPAPDWMSAAGAGLLDELGVESKPWQAAPFRELIFHDRTLKREARSTADKPQAYRIDYAALTRAMREHTIEAGAEFSSQICRIEPHEDHIDAIVGEEDCRPARVHLCASGVGDTGPQHMAWVAEVAFPSSGGTDEAMHWVPGIAGGRGLGCWWYNADRLIVRVHGRGGGDAVASTMVELLKAATERRLLPQAVRGIKPGQIRLRPTPASSALEMDSHVRKRCLLIGDAGGFVAEVTRESLYPALWSARIAAETVHQALDSSQPQDALREFSSTWRTAMGEHLRPPNTEMQFLYPLIFTNQQMADRLAAAFWRGENI